MTKKRKLILLIVCLALAVLAAGCAIAAAVLSGTLETQRADERWRGDSELRFAQASCFFPVGSEREETDILTFRQTIDGKLVDAGLEQPETGELWTDAWSSGGSVSVTGPRGSSEAAAIGVGGDFFVFHPLRLRSGSYITGDDLMDDRVVLDEELAWKLFGGYELEGLTVTIGGKPYYIAGVVEREDDFASERAYTGGAGIYMSYSALLENGGTKISCYELVCADPISGFVKGLVSDGLSEDGAFPVVENSARYGVSALFGIIGSFGERSMNTYGVVYPYWENAARLIEDWCALLLLLCVIFAAAPALCLLSLGIWGAVHGWRAAKRGAGRLKDRMETEGYRHASEKRALRERRRRARSRARELKRPGAHVKGQGGAARPGKCPGDGGRGPRREGGVIY